MRLYYFLKQILIASAKCLGDDRDAHRLVISVDLARRCAASTRATTSLMVTPKSIRLRRKLLDENDRKRADRAKEAETV